MATAIGDNVDDGDGNWQQRGPPPSLTGELCIISYLSCRCCNNSVGGVTATETATAATAYRCGGSSGSDATATATATAKAMVDDSKRTTAATAPGTAAATASGQVPKDGEMNG